MVEVRKFLRKYFNYGRTQDNICILKVTSKYSDTIRNCPELIRPLKKVHPKPWYDDELDALFFTIHDYILSRGIKIKITSCMYDDRLYHVTVGDRDIDFLVKKDVLYWVITLYKWNN